MARFCLYAKNFMKKINNKLFKKVLGKFATGITVVSINNKGDKIGKTVNSFTALSLSPPLVLFSLDKKSSSLIKYKKSKLFGINIHRATGRAGGKSIRVDKWSAGCQVIADNDDWHTFLDICQTAREIWGNSFSYTLLESKDIV